MLPLSRRRRWLALVLVLGCNRSARVAAPPAVAPLPVKAAAAARADLVAEVVLPHLDASLASVGALARKLQLPFGENELRTMAFARAPLPRTVFAQVELGKPVAVAVVVAGTKKDGAGADVQPVLAVALKDASAGGFDRFVASIGRVVGRDHDAVNVQGGDAGAGNAWLLPREGAVCVADSVAALTAGAALAVAARRDAPEDVRATIVPEGVARAQGTTLAQALQSARAALAAQRNQPPPALFGGRADPKMAAATAALGERAVGAMLDAVADTTEARFRLSLGAEKGLTHVLEIVPRPGSELAKFVSPRHPYRVDPGLLAGPAPGGLWAMGDLDFGRRALAIVQETLLATLAPAERESIGKALDAFLSGLAGPWSARFDFPPGGKTFQYDLAYSLRSAADGDRLLAATEAMMKAAWLPRLFETASGLKMKVASKREKGVLVTRMAFDFKRATPEVRKALEAMPLLQAPIETRSVVAGDRLLMSMGPGAAARLTALAQSADAAPSGELAAAVADTRGDDGLFYADLAAMLRPGLAMAAQNPAAAGGAAPMLGAVNMMLGSARLATWGSTRGGDTLAITWRVPLSTFESIATLARGFMGMGGRAQP